MIEQMKCVAVVTTSSNKTDLLSKIRDLGVLHISEKKAASSDLTSKLSLMQSTVQRLKEYDSQQSEKILSDEEFFKLNESVLKAIEDIKTSKETVSKLNVEADKIKAWGDFEPSEVNELRTKGIAVSFYLVDKKEIKNLESNENIKFIKLSPVDGREAVAVIGDCSETVNGSCFELPSVSLSTLEERISDCNSTITDSDKLLREASVYINSYKKQIIDLKNKIEWSSADSTAQNEDGLVVLEGYVPADDIGSFVKLAQANSWAYVIDDPADDDENVPTKIKYSKVSRLMKPIFALLGTIPGYREYDISFFFLCFFSLFFAMIIGDAGYGFIFLALGIALNVKQKKTSDLILLIYVLSACTIVWGAITGTWFGLEDAMKIGFLRALVVKPFANYPEYFGYTAVSQQNAIMKFCFIIGTVQLTLACLMNIRRKWKERNDSWVADAGWLISINSLYYVVLLLVIGENINLVPFAGFIILGFVLVCCFGGMSPDLTFKQGLKASLADSFTNFLNTISAFGNIMSYIRLFAVGLASLAIAQSFNDMALGFNGFMKVAGIVIFIIGHALNLVMGLLSVVVHGVRLNLLEFSGQLGMEWSGKEYEPFKVSEK